MWCSNAVENEGVAEGEGKKKQVLKEYGRVTAGDVDVKMKWNYNRRGRDVCELEEVVRKRFEGLCEKLLPQRDMCI